MNMQAMLKEAQKLQKEMMNEQEKINSMEFIGKSSLVTIKMNGKKEITSVEISDKIDVDDIDMIQDMIMIAHNDAIKQIDKEIENKMGKYTKGMPGLF